MADQIRLSPDQMLARAGEYDTQAGMVGDVISKMVQLMGALDSEWDGKAKESFIEKWNELKPSFDSAKVMIEEISARLKKTAENTRATDEANASAWG